MLFKRYKDLDELFIELNRGFLENPKEFIQYTQNIQGFNDNVLLIADSHKCTLDLSKFGYKKGKWGHLLRTYIDYPQLQEFHTKLGKVTGMSFTYYFNRKSSNNGACLISAVLTRKDRKGPWTKVNINWRVSESNRRFAADVILINRFIEELPKEHCDIQEVALYFNQIYCNAMFVNGYLDMFGVNIKSLKKMKHNWSKSVVSNYDRFFTSKDQINSYKALERMQMLYFGLEEFPPIPIDTLSIDGYFNRKK